MRFMITLGVGAIAGFVLRGKLPSSEEIATRIGRRAANVISDVIMEKRTTRRVDAYTSYR